MAPTLVEMGRSQLSKGIGVVIVVDYGSQYTQLIARRAREIGLQSIIVNGGGGNEEVARELEDVMRGRAGGEGGACVVLSGGPNSVHADDAPGIDIGVLESLTADGVPVLGICYGMQLLVSTYGGQVVKGGTQFRAHSGAAHPRIAPNSFVPRFLIPRLRAGTQTKLVARCRRKLTDS